MMNYSLHPSYYYAKRRIVFSDNKIFPRSIQNLKVVQHVSNVILIRELAWVLGRNRSHSHYVYSHLCFQEDKKTITKKTLIKKLTIKNIT